MKKINLWFWLPFTGGALLRLAWIWWDPLWYDENFTLAIARLPLDRMMVAIMGDVHPPLFYLLYRPLALLDLPAWCMRIPSVLLGILSLYLAWRVFSLLVRPEVQRVAFLLFSLGASASIYYAQESRMYALLSVLLLAATWSLLERKWWLLAIFNLALLYTQNYGLLFVPGLWLAGMIREVKDWKKLTLAAGLSALLYIPWVPVLLQQQANLSGGYWIPPFSLGVALYDLFHAFIQKGSFQFEVYCLIVFYSWISYSFWWYVAKRERAGLQIGALAFSPWLLAIAGSLLLGSSIMHYRSLVPLAPFLSLWLTIPLVKVKNETNLNNPDIPAPHADNIHRALPIS